MRQTFDKKIPVWQQRLRVMDKKTPGQKHGTKRRSSKVKEAADRKRRLFQAKQKADKARHTAKVAAYWRGAIEEHP